MGLNELAAVEELGEGRDDFRAKSQEGRVEGDPGTYMGHCPQVFGGLILLLQGKGLIRESIGVLIYGSGDRFAGVGSPWHPKGRGRLRAAPAAHGFVRDLC